MVTGMRRAEVLALRWSDVDLATGMLAIRRNYVRSGSRGIEKDTKTHQMRRISLDPETVAMLTDHRSHYDQQARALGVEPSDQAFVFSYQPMHDAPADPSAVTHRYGRMCAALGIDSHLHALRHYSATELLAAGVDLRTVAGRLGHPATPRGRAGRPRGTGRATVSVQSKPSTTEQTPLITSTVLAVVLRVAGPVTVGVLPHGLGHPERQVSVRIGDVVVHLTDKRIAARIRQRWDASVGQAMRLRERVSQTWLRPRPGLGRDFPMPRRCDD